MDFDSLIRETMGRVLEGGKALGGDRIDRENVQPTIDAFQKQVLAHIPHSSVHPIGSTGVKDSSGDIDLAIETDLDARKVAELVGELGFEKKLFPGLDQVSVLFPQHGANGMRLPRWIQVDLIVGDPAYLKWAHPSPADSKYKGFYTRAIANAIIRVTTGKHVNVTRGVFSKDDPEKKYSTDVASLAKQIGQGWTAEDLTGSLESIWTKCKESFTPEQLQGIRDYVKEFMENKKAPFPEELNEGAQDRELNKTALQIWSIIHENIAGQKIYSTIQTNSGPVSTWIARKFPHPPELDEYFEKLLIMIGGDLKPQDSAHYGQSNNREYIKVIVSIPERYSVQEWQGMMEGRAGYIIYDEQNAMVHEITHMIDLHRADNPRLHDPKTSRGFDNRKVSGPNRDPEHTKRYLNDPLETNATFHEYFATNRRGAAKAKSFDDILKKWRAKNIQDLVRIGLGHVTYRHKLSRDNQLRFMKRAAQFWQEIKDELDQKQTPVEKAVGEAVAKIARGIVPAYGNTRGGSTVTHAKGAQVGQGNIGGARNRGTPGYPVPPAMTSKRGQEGEVDGGSLEVLEINEAKSPDDLDWGIKHLEDLKPEEFMKFLERFKDVEIEGKLEISEKVDGSARISFGPGNGHIWTQTKTGTRKAMSSQYPDTSMFKPIKEAHKALESKREDISKAWPEGVTFMVAEVLYGKVPNTIEYGESRIIIHGVHGYPGGELNDTAAKKAATAVVKACHGAAGDFKLEYKRTINPRDVMVDVKEEYDTLGDLLQKLQSDRGAKSKFKQVQKQVKQKLLMQLRKQSSAYGPEGGDVEGLVFRDLESGQMVKLVDQDYFRELNEFMWSWRNRLNKDVLGGFSQTVAKNVLGDVGAASNRLVTNILAAGKAKSELSPHAAADTLIANYIIKNNLMKQGFLESFSEALDGAAGDLEKLEAEWNGVLGSEITQNIAGKLRVMGPEVKGRTQESINDAKATLSGIRAGVEAAQSIQDPLTQKVAIFKLFMGHKFDRLVDKLGSDTSFSNENTVIEGGPIDRMTGPTDLSGAPRIDGEVPDGEEVNEAPKWLKGITAATMMGLAAPTAIDNTEPPPPKPYVEPAKPSREELIDAARQKYGLPEFLLPAMIHVESGGKPTAVSHRGAKGLMQINTITQQHLGVTDPHDEAQSIEGGAKYMRQLLDRFNNKLDKALAAYNAGPTFVAKAKPDQYPRETKRYIKKVKHEMRKLAHAKKPIESVIRETFAKLNEAGEQYVGATIGRYQPFHAGHAAIIRQLAHRYTHVLVFVAGLKQDQNNPFSYDLRLEMMEKSLPDVWSKISVYPASIQGKGTGYIPGLVANVVQAGELDSKQPVTVLVGEDRLAAVRQQVEHNNKHMGEPGYFTGTIEAEALPGVKSDDDADRISGTRLRAAIAKDDRKEIKRMLDPHLVSDPASLEEILVKMANDLKGKPQVSVESIVEEVIAELGMGGLETGVGFTKGGAWGSSGWSRAILAGDEDGDEMFQQMLKSPSTRMLPMANHGTPNSDLPGINRVEGEPNEDELRQPTDLDEVILRVLRKHSVVR